MFSDQLSLPCPLLDLLPFLRTRSFSLSLGFSKNSDSIVGCSLQIDFGFKSSVLLYDYESTTECYDSGFLFLIVHQFLVPGNLSGFEKTEIPDSAQRNCPDSSVPLGPLSDSK